MTWTLILFATIGGMNSHESNAFSSIKGFASQEQCRVAGREAAKEFDVGTKNVAFVCVQVGGK